MNALARSHDDKIQADVEFSATKAAALQIKTCLEKRGKGIGVRVGVRTTGCSGLAYTLEYVDTPDSADKIYLLEEGLAVYIDPKAYQYLKGSIMDYAKHGLNSGFEFINPNEKSRCGCGESFSV